MANQYVRPPPIGSIPTCDPRPTASTVTPAGTSGRSISPTPRQAVYPAYRSDSGPSNCSRTSDLMPSAPTRICPRTSSPSAKSAVADFSSWLKATQVWARPGRRNWAALHPHLRRNAVGMIAAHLDPLAASEAGVTCHEEDGTLRYSLDR